MRPLFPFAVPFCVAPEASNGVAARCSRPHIFATASPAPLTRRPSSVVPLCIDAGSAAARTSTSARRSASLRSSCSGACFVCSFRSLPRLESPVASLNLDDAGSVPLSALGVAGRALPFELLIVAALFAPRFARRCVISPQHLLSACDLTDRCFSFACVQLPAGRRVQARSLRQAHDRDQDGAHSRHRYCFVFSLLGCLWCFVALRHVASRLDWRNSLEIGARLVGFCFSLLIRRALQHTQPQMRRLLCRSLIGRMLPCAASDGSGQEDARGDLDRPRPVQAQRCAFACSVVSLRAFAPGALSYSGVGPG